MTTDMQAPIFDPIRAAAGAVVLHWDEFGPESGFDESMDRLRAALASRPDAQAKTGATGWKLAMRVMQSDLFDKLDDAERAECDALVRANPYLGRSSTAAAQVDERGAFQSRVQPWMLACFGAEIAADTVERNHRFFEEAAELVQSCGMTASEAHQLVDYTWSRPVGEKTQEVGGVMVTLAALCLANGLDMHAAGETELARISDPETMAKIRAKQAAKPKHSPLPEARAAAPQAARDQHEKSDLYKEGYLAGKAAAAAPSPDREQVGEAAECCDTPNYCSSVRRCTAQDASPSREGGERQGAALSAAIRAKLPKQLRRMADDAEKYRASLSQPQAAEPKGVTDTLRSYFETIVKYLEADLPGLALNTAEKARALLANGE